jgi:hypothetical protein
VSYGVPEGIAGGGALSEVERARAVCRARGKRVAHGGRTRAPQLHTWVTVRVRVRVGANVRVRVRAKLRVRTKVMG